MERHSTSENQKTETLTSSSVETKFGGFWYWASEMERLGQWPGLSEAFKERSLEGSNNHASHSQTRPHHTPSVLRR